jgi:GMP synthase (glutamine-hydrolysing)
VLCGAVRRRRLRRGRGARAQGDRRPAHLRVRRPRAAAQGRARAGREGLRRITGIKLVVADAEEQFLAALAGVSEPGEKRKIIGREFIRVFEQTVRDIAWDDADGTSSSSSRARSTPTSSSPAAARGRQHQEPPQRRRPARRPAVHAHRAAARPVQGRGPPVGEELGLPTRWCGASPSPARASASASSARSPASGSDLLRAADAIAREELAASGLEKDIWQFPVVLLADVRSVGVQGDGRTYGHPIVLRPVTSEDAMTADWSRLPYDVLEKISTRITNEVREVNRVVLDVTSKPPGTIEWE